MSEEQTTLTIKEFKMWLRGVEEMQPEGWSPSQQQWTRIREKIDSITETAPTSQPQPQQQQQQVVYRDPIPQAPVYPQQVVHAQPGLTQQRGPTYSAPAPNNPLFGNADTPAIAVKTPNVDTSAGGYEPAFI